MTQHDAMHERMDQEHAADDEEGMLTKQTPGLDEGVTSSIAGPDWDPEFVREAATEVEGRPLEGQVEEGRRPRDPRRRGTRSRPRQGAATRRSSSA